MSDEQLHIKILQIFDEQIVNKDFKRIRSACTPFIPPSQMEDITSMRELNNKLEVQGRIGVGNYTLLLKILDDLQLLKVKGLVQDVAKRITSPLSSTFDCGSATQCDDDDFGGGSSTIRDYADFGGGSSTIRDYADLTPSKEKKGLVVIINIAKFDKSADRKGSEKDVEKVEALFTNESDFGGRYSVLTFINCTLDQLKANLTVCQEELRRGKYDQFICFIFSHGDEQGIRTKDEEHIKIEEIIKSFKGNVIPQMNGLPKVFIFQACRGEEIQQSLQVDCAGANDLPNSTVIEPEGIGRAVPVDADIVVAFATTRGFYSFRHPSNGSWYIRNICEVFSEFKQDHLLDLLTVVNERVSKQKGKFEGKDAKQIPSFESTFRYKMYLHVKSTVAVAF